MASHLLALVFPLATLAYAATGPHPTWALPIPALLIGLAVAADHWLGRVRPSSPDRATAPDAAADGTRWPYDLLLYALAAIQIVTVALLVRMAAQGGLSPDLVLTAVLVGNNSGWSAIVVAHELVHRKRRGQQLLGRLLLGTVLYEHFFTEHLRGHHARVGTPADPATARYGEGLGAFTVRSVVGQIRSAWRLEAGRPWWTNRVLHGWVAQGMGLVAIGVAFGPAALFAFVWQAGTAVALLEAVNYFEHWGLTRRGRRAGLADSWDSESWFTLRSLVGLALHADHHVNATRPFPALRRAEASPKLPYGYYMMVALAQLRPARFKALMTEELRRRGLGPFAEGAERSL